MLQLGIHEEGFMRETNHVSIGRQLLLKYCGSRVIILYLLANVFKHKPFRNRRIACKCAPFFAGGPQFDSQ